MQQRIVLGASFVILGLIAGLNPSVTGAVIGASETNSILLLSLPLIALGAAVIANALKTVFS